jgi:hypothetical protein
VNDCEFDTSDLLVAVETRYSFAYYDWRASYLDAESTYQEKHRPVVIQSNADLAYDWLNNAG